MAMARTNGRFSSYYWHATLTPCLDAEAFMEDVVNLTHLSLPIVALMG